MKKILATILVVVLIAALPMAVSADRESRTNEGQITLNIKKAAQAPVIDGILDADFYEEIPFIQANFGFDDKHNDGNLPFLMDPGNVKGYVAYDDAHVYIFISGSDRYYYNDRDQDDSGNIWNRSSIQIGLGAANAEGNDFMELGFARNSYDGGLIQQMWFNNTDGALFDMDDFQSMGGAFAIALSGGRINYEVRVPWTAFLASAPSVGGQFRLGWLIHFYDNDFEQGGNNRMIVDFGDGITGDGPSGGKASQDFALVTLSADVLEAAAEEPEADEPEAQGGSDDAPAPRPTPRTGDAGTIALIALMAVAAAGIVVIRRKAVK
jgi:hypothetical protein